MIRSSAACAGREKGTGREANISVSTIQSAAKYNLYISFSYSHLPPAVICLKCSGHINKVGSGPRSRQPIFISLCIIYP